jgi:hypothetical protein
MDRVWMAERSVSMKLGMDAPEVAAAVVVTEAEGEEEDMVADEVVEDTEATGAMAVETEVMAETGAMVAEETEATVAAADTGAVATHPAAAGIIIKGSFFGRTRQRRI